MTEFVVPAAMEIHLIFQFCYFIY